MFEDKLASAVAQQQALLDPFFLAQQGGAGRFCRPSDDDLQARRPAFSGGSGPFAAIAGLLGQQFLHRQTLERPPLPAVALTHDAGLATFLAAEQQESQLFSRQLRALANDQDTVLLLAGTSLCLAGREALATARQIGCRIALICADAGRVARSTAGAVAAVTHRKPPAPAGRIPVRRPSAVRHGRGRTVRHLNCRDRLSGHRFNLAGRLAVVIGAGAVGRRKTAGLLAAGARVRLVSLDPVPPSCWHAAVEFHQRPFHPGDLDGATLVFAATGSAAVDRSVLEAAHARGIPANLAAAPQSGDFTLPAMLRQGELLVTVSTGGRAPAMAKATCASTAMHTLAPNGPWWWRSPPACARKN